MRVKYRPGLPPIEMARAHEERTEDGLWMRRRRVTADIPVPGFPEFTTLNVRHWRYILSSGVNFNALEYRPVSDDGETMPWPDEAQESRP